MSVGEYRLKDHKRAGHFKVPTRPIGPAPGGLVATGSHPARQNRANTAGRMVHFYLGGDDEGGSLLLWR
jgi:hypothetical protein